MNVEIGTEAAQSPEKEYTNGNFVTVRWYLHMHNDTNDTSTCAKCTAKYSVMDEI